ncbi:hypothetical protein ACFE04_011824 [Oxalis oulophora]
MKDNGVSPPLTCPNTTVRRNPPRKARPTTLTAATKHRDPAVVLAAATDIPSFPIDDILSIKIPKTTPTPPESLRVFVRIRPQKQQPKEISKTKNAWPKKNPVKKGVENTKKKEEKYIVIDDDEHSVTLTPPVSLQESKRCKSETYKGFSHVFAPDSSQVQVYDTMVKPLVDDFLKGKSGMLAALGPTGSGKTHTVFGTARDPGMVPLVLRQIFDHEPSRSFYLSVFEICSERGKGERLSDLSEDGQLTSKGFKEVSVSETNQAESIIACAMRKRATAMTNSNSQSSRSQCIINIRSVYSKFDQRVNIEADSAVLTIVDLAGAEREKRTGNQGTRLIESNFINNTSMVFGLCLRSLLEHQKNPKKPLQKHFQNSLLTRYLRDYLEGKNRMALVLTVKSGEKDYLDTSYLLRQASPFMQIKFENVDESSNNLPNKRHFQTQFRNEQPKRMKLNRVDLSTIEHGKNSSEEQQLPKEEVSRTCKQDVNDSALSQMDSVKMAKRDRSEQIMQNFAKALWTVLKEYKGKLKVAEGEIQILTQSLNNEKKKSLELEKELESLRRSSNCDERSCDNSPGQTSIEPDDSSEFKTDLKKQENTNFNQADFDTHPTNCQPSEEWSSPPGKYDSSKQDEDIIHLINDKNIHSPNPISTPNMYTPDKFYNSRVEKLDMNSGLEQQESTNTYNEDASSLTKLADEEIAGHANTSEMQPETLNLESPKCSPTSNSDKEETMEPDVVPNSEVKPKTCDKSLNMEITKPPVMFSNESSDSQKDESEPKEKSDMKLLSKAAIPTKDHNSPVPKSEVQSQTFEKPLNMDKPNPVEQGLLDDNVLVKEKVKSTKGHDDTLSNKAELKKTPNPGKPKRRLMPASTILVRDISGLDLEDPPEKQRGKKGRDKVSGKMTQGSISLLRLLKTNHPR